MVNRGIMFPSIYFRKGKRKKMQVKSLNCNQQYIIIYKRREFLIRNRKDMMRLMRLQDKLRKKEKEGILSYPSVWTDEYLKECIDKIRLREKLRRENNG